MKDDERSTKDLANELILAWQEWEKHPGTDYTARRHEDAIQAVARYMGTTGSKLIEALAAKRRDGQGSNKLSIARVVRLLFKTIEAEQR